MNGDDTRLQLIEKDIQEIKSSIAHFGEKVDMIFDKLNEHHQASGGKLDTILDNVTE